MRSCKLTLRALALIFTVLVCISPVFAALTVQNSSFEADTVSSGVGYCSITDWTGGSGINNSTINPFADNGTIPDGSNVAFIQGAKTMSQVIDGFEAGKTYLLTYRENARTGSIYPIVNVTIGDTVVVASHSVTPTHGDYYYRSGKFTASAGGSYTLSFNSTNSGDNTVLIDDVKVLSADDYSTISGVVTDSSSAPIEGANIVLIGSNGKYASTTDADGKYTFYVVPGTYNFVVSKANYKPMLSDCDLSVGASIEKDVVLTDRTTPAAYYVSDSGSDSNDGSSIENAWSSIDNGEKLGILQAGDTVFVKGNFSSSVSLGSVSGSNVSPITYKSLDSAVISIPSGSAGITVSGSTAKYIVIDGFELSGGEYGVRCNSGASNITVKNCFIHDINPYSAGEGNGIRDENTTNDLFVNNVIYNVGYANLFESSPEGSVAVGGSTNTQIYNNTFDTATDALRLWNSSKNVKFKNNICVNMRWSGIHSDDASISIDNTNNLFYFDINGGSGSEEDYENISAGAYEFNADPLFVSGYGSGYQLQDGSPAIDSGVVIAGINDNYSGSAPDMGAYESSSSASYGFLTGKVLMPATDYRPASGIGGAVVTNSDNTISATTGNDGSYAIPLAAGSYNFSASYLNNQALPNPASISITSGNSTNQDFTLPALTCGTTYYVKPDGDDSKSGLTLANAWKTINNGDVTKVLAAGDKVEVEAGTYPQADGFGIKIANCSGTKSQPIVYKANGKVIIDQTGATPIWNGQDVMCAYVTQNGIAFDGFEFKNSQWGIFFENGSSNNIVANCSFHDLNPVTPGAGGFPGFCSGLVCAHGDNDLIKNNVFYNIGSTDLAGGCIAVTFSMTNTYIYNNVFDNAKTVLWDWATPGACVFENNIVTNMKGSALGYSASGALTHDYNQFYNNASDYGTNANKSAHEFNTNPLFDTNYALKSNSPAIDSGVNLGYIFNGTAPDLGAFESDGSVSRAYVTGSVTIEGSAADATVATSDGSASTKTCSDGTYFIPVAAGNVTLTATTNGLDPMTVQTTATAGSTTTQNINFTFSNVAAKDHVSDLKLLSVGTLTRINGAVVTSGSNVFGDNSFYIEDANRASGIKAVLDSSLSTVVQGDKADFVGTVAKDSSTGDAYFKVTYVLNKVSGSSPAPIGMNNKAIAGSGVSTRSLLVKTWGKVTYKDADNEYMYIDDGSNISDGSGNTGIKVILNGTNDVNLPYAADVNDNVTVTGIVVTSGTSKAIQARSAMDISNINDANVAVHESDIGIAWDGVTAAWEADINTNSEVYPTLSADGLKITESASEGWNQLHFRGYDGTLLSNLTKLQYGEFVNNMPTQQSNLTLSAKIWIDSDGDGTRDMFLICEPWKQGYNGVAGVWQTIDLLKDGKWWCITSDWSSTLVDRDHAVPLSDYVTQYPNAKIATDYEGGIIIYASDLSAPSANYVVTLGDVIVGTTTGGTTVYSFAP